MASSTAAAPSSSRLHFLGGAALPPDSPCSADISRTLNALPPATVGALTELARRVLQRDTTLDLVAAADSAASAAGLRSNAQAAALRAALRTLVFALTGCLKHHVTAPLLREDLAGLGLEAGRADLVAAAWDAASPALQQQAADRALLGGGLGAGALVDAELRFGVTVSTDDVARVGQTFLQLRLATAAAAAPGGVEHRQLELSIPEFYALLSALETAQSYVTALS